LAGEQGGSMSWEDVLKKVGLDLDEADKACCETAKQALIEFMDREFEDIDDTLNRIDQADCSNLYEFMVDGQKAFKNNQSKSPEELRNQYGPSYDHAFVTDCLNELSDIIDEFDKCKDEAKKVKDDLKVKPEVIPIRGN